jgi:hypothetical protein
MGFKSNDPYQHQKRKDVVKAIQASKIPWQKPLLNVATDVCQLSSGNRNGPSTVGGTGYNTPLSGAPPYKS